MYSSIDFRNISKYIYNFRNIYIYSPTPVGSSSLAKK